MKLRAFSDSEIPSFEKRLASISNFLPEESFQELRQEIQSISGGTRVDVLPNRKGHTISYEELRAAAPHVIELYTSPEYQAFISTVIHTPIQQTPLTDDNSLSILIYEKPGDKIDWHYDNNFYKGRRFTILLAIENRGGDENGLSAAKLWVRGKTKDTYIPTPPNTLIVFEGSKIYHRATQIKEGERRVLLSMTYCTDPRNSFIQHWGSKIQNAAFFGLKALWK